MTKKSSLELWAEKEVELACIRAKGSSNFGEYDYGVACTQSAFKAFKSLKEDGHSGMSIMITKNILNRLIDGLPLTPIEDTNDVWDFGHEYGYGYVRYQCKRMPSLFKNIYSDGSIKYTDTNRCVCIDIQDPSNTYTTGIVDDIINEMYPITMPYYPSSNRIKVYCEDFLMDEKNGDFDYRAVLYAVLPNGNRVDINRYFDGSGDGWRQIDRDEYYQRKSLAEQKGKRSRND